MIIKNVKKKNSRFGRYPSCDMLNNALRFYFDGNPIEDSISEIIYAIQKADGYIYDDLKDKVDKFMKEYWNNRK